MGQMPRKLHLEQLNATSGVVSYEAIFGGPKREWEAALRERACNGGGSPLLPPTIIFIGGGEVLAEDGRRLSASLSRLCPGCPQRVQLYEEPDAAHDWLLLPWFDVKPGSAGRGMDALTAFILEACGRDSPPPPAGAASMLP